MTDAELIERACEGEAAAARTIYERHAPRVFAVVRRLAGDEDLAHDFAQEAWVRVFRALPSFRGDARLSSWIHRIAVNAALQGLRRDGTRERHTAHLDEVRAVPGPTEDHLLQSRLEEALDRLPEGMRRVLVLHDVEGYTHQEIAEMFGVTEGTSKSQLFKARTRMRVLLSGLVTPDREGGMAT